MTSVYLQITKLGRLTTPVGRIDFYALPLRNQGDFLTVPSDIVSFAEVQTISLELSRQAVQGKVGRYEWRLSS
jgi:hypothetical protein